MPVNLGNMTSGGGSDYSMRNCAYCTVAAIFGTDSLQISKMLGLGGIQAEGGFSFAHRRKYHIPSPGPLMGDVELALDIEGIKDFVEALKTHIGAPVKVSQGGDWGHPPPMSVQKRFMLGYPARTQFAVWAYVGPFKGLGAHWNYAVRTVDGLEFRDYQYDTPGGSGPAVSGDFIPPKGNEDEVYTHGIVLVFRPADTRMPWE